ncbi:MAG: ABC transporter permease [Armatimonadota bacterium]
MLGFVVRRLLHVLVVLFFGLLFVFLIAHAIPADPARMAMGEMATEEAVAKYRRDNGLDRPLPVQFGIYLRRLLRGDLGRSILTTRRVVDELRAGVPATIELVVPALLLAAVAGVSLGVLSAAFSGRATDHAARVVSLYGMSMPVFWLGLVVQLIFFRWLDILPIGQRLSQGLSPPPPVTGLYTVDSLLAGDLPLYWSAVKHLILPVIVLSLDTLATLARISRASILEVLQADYVRTARSKGLIGRLVLFRHALPNAMIPIITVIGLRFGGMLGGAVIVETIFAWPGVGRRAFQSLLSVDYPMVMGFTLWMVLVYGLVNLLVDLTYPFIDPRIRHA